jgi:hypothetical protein
MSAKAKISNIGERRENQSAGISKCEKINETSLIMAGVISQLNLIEEKAKKYL